MAADNRFSELGLSIRSLFPQFSLVIGFSLFTNLLSLASTLYMLEVYDRVVNSRSVYTLLMLSVLVVFAYILLEIMEWVRGDILARCSVRWDDAIRNRLFSAFFDAQLSGVQNVARSINDWRTVREFISGSLVIAVLDTPVALLILLILFLIHLNLGLFALAVVVLQIIIAIVTERRIREPLLEAQQSGWQAQRYAEESMRNIEVLEAMGMVDDFRNKWNGFQDKSIKKQAEASIHSATSTSLVKLVQLIQASALLGIGVWLVISGHPMTGGTLMLVSVLGGKALAPFVQVITQWRQLITVKAAFVRLRELLEKSNVPEKKMPLPAPAGRILLEDIKASPPGSSLPVIRGITMDIPPGRTVAFIGPSASGKSSLVRLLVGAWKPVSGKVRIDGSDLQSWDKFELGPYIGYLPQTIELFDGSIAENIARFGEIDQGKIEAAAQSVGLHEFIMRLPAGYSEYIGAEGAFLSGGLRQRVALARAIYGSPRIVVLDEPNSSLDSDGELALAKLVSALKKAGVTVLLVTHRPALLDVVDALAVVQDGMLKAYGPKDEVMAKLQAGAALQQAGRKSTEMVRGDAA